MGLGFGDRYQEFPGGLTGFCRFLSSGNKNFPEGMATAKAIEPYVSKDFLEDFLDGEIYLKSPELVEDFVKGLPIMQIPKKYVVMKPLYEVSFPGEEPEVIVILATPLQLSVLVILANYARQGSENVIIPYAAACQTIGIYAYREAASSSPRAVVGLTDISGRLNTLKQLGGDFLSFAVPWKMFMEMENNVEGSFLTRKTWLRLSGSLA